MDVNNLVKTAPEELQKHEQLTADLRWRNGVLEQRWVILTVVEGWGVIKETKSEWRPVPTVES